MNELPKQTAAIFDYLSKGHFINSNSIDQVQRELYSVLEDQENLDILSNYFKQIGFQLESGDGFFYFSREEDRAGMERKINAAFKWIDIMDFITTFHSGFAPGLRFYTTDLVEQVRVNGLLRTKLQDMNTRSASPSSKEQIGTLLKKMEREGFIEKVDEFDDAWKVTAALNDLQQLIMAIELPEEEDENLIE